MEVDEAEMCCDPMGYHCRGIDSCGALLNCQNSHAKSRVCLVNFLEIHGTQPKVFPEKKTRSPAHTEITHPTNIMYTVYLSPEDE